jgi:hypothetical protein
MPRDWDDSWYDDDEFPPVRKNRGRAGIVGAAVMSFVMCGFNALSAMGQLCCGVMLSLVGPDNGGPVMPADLINYPFLLIFTGVGSVVSFVMQIVAGIGLINARRWARTTSFYLAGYSTLISLFLAYLAVTSFTHGNDEVFGQGVLWTIGFLFHTGYALTIFLVLSGDRVAASLR